MMPLSNSKIIKSEKSSESVVDYQARKIKGSMPKHVDKAHDFEKEFSGEAPSFKMDELLEDRMGIGEKRQAEIMSIVEEKTIEKFKEVEEDAYQKAYELGKKEGQEEGLQSKVDEVSQKLHELDILLDSMYELRRKLITQNEAAIVKLCFEMAKRIAMRDISGSQESILSVVQNLADSMQSEIEVTVRMAPEDVEFVEEFQSRDPKTKEMFKKLKILKDEYVKSGECIFESNAGVIDATMEERLNKLWTGLSENIPEDDTEAS
ncbi:MAG: FliH/SctL family protein [Bdellovibrionales bacterium]